ncbi:hypothetical protein CEXT_765821 [Caerostris extrusa]|uniref:Uncharacterized protein n=1 Tax=Caerostris extrusa TaxID=172846 RepID=A0AAV4XD19_CAEEX|nr:hypothetical protein CEXT_765821 [Caerostris extrusa]
MNCLGVCEDTKKKERAPFICWPGVPDREAEKYTYLVNLITALLPHPAHPGGPPPSESEGSFVKTTPEINRFERMLPRKHNLRPTYYMRELRFCWSSL